MISRLITVSSAKTDGVRRRRPSIRLSGLWLQEIGFAPNAVVTAKYEYGVIELSLHGEGMEAYKSIDKKTLTTSSGTIQITKEYKNKKITPCFQFLGYWLEEYGFTIGSVVYVQSEYGKMTLKLLDVDAMTRKKASCN